MKTISALVGLVLAATLTPTAFADDAMTTRTVYRAYGDGPVRIGKADVVQVRFDGRKGDRVRLAGARCPVSLHGPSGAVVMRADWASGD